MALYYPDRLEANNPAAYGIVKAILVAGHKTVESLTDLYALADVILSDSGTNENDDAIGQLWYVVSEGANYRLDDWPNRTSATGWTKLLNTDTEFGSLLEHGADRITNFTATETTVTLNYNTWSSSSESIDNSTDIPLASSTSAGSMSATDKIELDRIISANFTLGDVTETTTSVSIAATKTNISDGSSVSESVTIPEATTSTAGVMTAEDKSNLDQVQTDLLSEITNRTSADESLLQQITSLEEELDNYEENVSDTYATILQVVNLHASVVISADKRVIYKGESDTVTLSHSATFDGNPLTYTIKIDDADLSNPYTLEDSHVFTAIFSIDNTDPNVTMDVERTLAVDAAYPRYYGALTSSTISGSDVTTLVKLERSLTASNDSLTVEFSEAGYLWLCVPEGMTITTVTSSGFSVPMEDPVTVEVTDKGNYLCYRSTYMVNSGSVNYIVNGTGFSSTSCNDGSSSSSNTGGSTGDSSEGISELLEAISTMQLTINNLLTQIASITPSDGYELVMVQL